VSAIPRRSERRARFQAAFNDMPRWEKWDEEVVAPATTATINYRDGEFPESTAEVVGEPIVRHHAKLILRRIRRDMARKRSLREYRRDHGLPEPR